MYVVLYILYHVHVCYQWMHFSYLQSVFQFPHWVGPTNYFQLVFTVCFYMYKCVLLNVGVDKLAVVINLVCVTC